MLTKFLEKLLLSAVSNWERKNEDASLEEAGLRIKAVWVDGAGMLKRLKPAPQGRAHKIRKRSSHVTLIVDSTREVTRLSSGAEKRPVEPVKQIEKDTNGAKS